MLLTSGRRTLRFDVKCFGTSILLTGASYLLVIHVYQAEFVPKPDPSLTEQYEFANEHDIKCLVIITDSGVTHKGSVKVIFIPV